MNSVETFKKYHDAIQNAIDNINAGFYDKVCVCPSVTVYKCKNVIRIDIKGTEHG